MTSSGEKAEPKESLIIEEWKSRDLTSLNYLNDACLLEIFSLLPFKKKIQLTQVCQRWRALMPMAFRNHRSLPLGTLSGKFEWRIISGPDEFKCGSHIFRSVLEMMPNHFESILFPYISQQMELSASEVQFLVSRCPDVKVLDLTYTCVSQEGILALEGKLNKLESLKMPKSAINEEKQRRVMATMSNMKCRSRETETLWGRVMATMSSLKHVDLSLSDFTGKCLVELKEVQTIQSVILNGNLHEKYLKQFLQSHPKLIELCLSDNSTEISYLPQLCPNLSVLNLSWSWEYRNRQENDFLIRPFPLFTSLKELVVSLNYHFDHAALKSLCNSCPKLQVLNCMYTRVTPNQLSCLRRLKNLRTLRLAFINDDIGRVTDEVLTNIIDGSGGNIEELLVEGCTNLTDSSLIDLASQCPKLSKLYLSYSPKVTTNGWRKFLNIITSHPYCESQPRRQIVIEEAWMKISSLNLTEWKDRVIFRCRGTDSQHLYTSEVEDA